MPVLTYKEYQKLPENEKLNRARYLKPVETQALFNPIDIWDQTYGESYQIGMYGVLPNGQKAKVTITNINPCYDVEIPENAVVDEFAMLLYDIFKAKDIEMAYTKEPVLQKTYRGFTEPLRWLRIHFKKLKDRNDSLTLIKGKYNTGNNDGGNFRAPHSGYPLKASRENGFSLSSWNTITNYKIIKEGFPTIIEVDMANIKAAPEYEQPMPAVVAYCDTETNGTVIGRLSNPEIAEEEMFIITTTFCRPFEKEKLDNLTICQFKGLTADELKTMITTNNDFVITCDNEKEMLEAFITVYGDVLPDFWVDFNGIGFDQNYFYHRLKRYNIDNKYWARSNRGWVQETNDYSAAIGYPNKVVYYTLLDKFFNVITNRYDTRDFHRPFFNYKASYSENSFSWKKFGIKINADKMEYGHGFVLPGLFYIDARVVMMKTYSTESESSLKYYLKKLGLPPKKDMPYTSMWGLFADAKVPYKGYTLQELIDYASWDAESCHSMFLKIDLYINRIANAILTEVSLYDEFYHAGGMKARNMLMMYGYRGVKDYYGNNIPVAFSTCHVDALTAETEVLDLSYGGGHVVSPKFTKSGRVELPVAPHDFASLYPSITMGYNISYDTALRDEELVNKYKDKYLFERIDFTLGAKGVPHKTWYLKYKFDSDDMTPGTELGMGVLPTILSDLKSKRDYVKKQEAVISDEIDDCRKTGAPTAELELRKSVYKAKQLAIKVQMNTFYGECGNKNSPFFFVDLAASITSVGRDGLKFVIALVEFMGFFVHYGDTDSVYSSAPIAVFKLWLDWYNEAKLIISGIPNGVIDISDPPPLSDAIEKWAIKQTKGNINALIPIWGSKQTDLHPDIRNVAIAIDVRQRLLKEELYRRMVIIAQYEASVLEVVINDALIARTGTKRLSMAYEEVLYPNSFDGKKKYVGVQNILPDVRLIGFDWSKKAHKFIRGLDFIKRGMAPIMREIGEEVIIKFLDIMEERTVREVVEESIKTFATRKWAFEGFIKSAEYKPNNKGGANILAVRRWQKEKKHIPAPGERFNFVYVKRTDDISPFGRRIPLKASDRMETPEYAQEHNLEIDIDKYMSGSIQGLLARFISYDDEFRANRIDPPKNVDIVDEEDDDEEDEDDEDDKRAIHMAKKSIARMIKLCMKGEYEVTPKEVKVAAMKKFDDICALLPSECGLAFEVYKKFLILEDGEKCKGKSLTPFVNYIIDAITVEVRKIKFDPKAMVFKLLERDISKDDVYQMFVGSLHGKTLTQTYRETIKIEQTDCLTNLMTMEIDIENIETLKNYSSEFNRLFMLRHKSNCIMMIAQEAFSHRDVPRRLVNMSGNREPV